MEPSTVLIIIALIVCVIILASLVKKYADGSKPSVAMPSSPAKTAAPSLRSTVGPKQSPQITVYSNPVSPNAFRCPVCDSRPAPSARNCPVCGQDLTSKGVH